MSETYSDIQKLKAGDSAPEFYLRNVDERAYNLSEFKGKIVVIIFMCNHCPYVKAKLKEIIAIQNEYQDKGVVVIGINANDAETIPEDDFEHMQALAKEIGLKWYLWDELQEVARKYGALCTPDPFVFDKEHKLVYHGRINDAMGPNERPTKHDIRDVLDKLLEEKPIEEWFKPSIGCSIKWK